MRVDGKLITFAAVDHLSLQQITLNYHDAALHKSLSFVLDTMEGTAARNEAVLWDMAGHVQERKYVLKLSGSPLIELLNGAGEPWKFEINGEVFGKAITSSGNLTLRGGKSEINMAIGLQSLDVGAILAELQLVDGLHAILGDVNMQVSVVGGSLQEMLQQSSFAVEVREGNWKVNLPSSDTHFDIKALSGSIQAEKANNITMNLQGVIDKTPVSLLISSAPLVDYVIRKDELPLGIVAEMLRLKLSITSKIKLPVSARDMHFSLQANSERIDYLNDFFQLDLPACLGAGVCGIKASAVTAGL